MNRCEWVNGADDAMLAYHDIEWGVPVDDDIVLFEFLTLEGAQAGLSWQTILRKREGYRRAFAGFDPAKVAKYTDDDAARLLGDEGIVRNRAKIASTIANAAHVLAIQQERGSFARYVWGFVEGSPILNAHPSLSDLPASTSVSDAFSKDLRRRGFRFVGTTICYAFMQAVGMVNDHTIDCFRYGEIVALSEGRR